MKIDVDALPKTGTTSAKILEALGPSPLTDEEIGLVVKRATRSITARRGELVRKGWVENSGKRRLTDSGTNAIVWQLKEVFVSFTRTL